MGNGRNLRWPILDQYLDRQHDHKKLLAVGEVVQVLCTCVCSVFVTLLLTVTALFFSCILSSFCSALYMHMIVHIIFCIVYYRGTQNLLKQTGID